MNTSTELGHFSTDLPYLAFGSGKPLVYLAGFTMTHTVPQPGAQRRTAARMVAPFVAAGYQVYWTNRRPGMPVGATMSDVAAEHAEALRDRFGTPVPVLGHATGGSIALQLAIENPEVVSWLVLAGTAHSLGPVARRFHRDLLEAAGRGRSAMHRAAPALTRNRLLQLLLMVPLWIAGRFDPPPKDHSDMKAMLLAEGAFDVRGRLGEVRVPTLLLRGARDYLCTPERFHETADGIPGAQRVEYPRSGHAITTKPAFFHDVLAFLEGP
ncbi:alpha/beta fold hydrolase [Streptomyces sp. NPDC052236]|uniref:alpha/beta fold hydrolase n=1 Tax=Streptomyces sp. NPDC052236 TaxID=3365686 RepID=UPI0037CCEFCD